MLSVKFIYRVMDGHAFLSLRGASPRATRQSPWFLATPLCVPKEIASSKTPRNDASGHLPPMSAPRENRHDFAKRFRTRHPRILFGNSCDETKRVRDLEPDGNTAQPICTTSLNLAIIIAVYEPRLPKWVNPFERGKTR